MYPTQLKQAANIILETAIQTLANIHGTTVAQVEAGLRAEHPKLIEQFAQLVAAGCRAAADTMEDRLDILEAVTVNSPVGA